MKEDLPSAYVTCLAISFWAWSEGLARKTAGQVGIYLYLEPLFTMLGAAILLNERITIWIVMGAALIIIAVYISEPRRRVGIIRQKPKS